MADLPRPIRPGPPEVALLLHGDVGDVRPVAATGRKGAGPYPGMRKPGSCPHATGDQISTLTSPVTPISGPVVALPA